MTVDVGKYPASTTRYVHYNKVSERAQLYSHGCVHPAGTPRAMAQFFGAGMLIAATVAIVVGVQRMHHLKRSSEPYERLPLTTTKLEYLSSDCPTSALHAQL